MPFTKLADLTTYDKYKAALKSELGAVGPERVKYFYYEGVELAGGSKGGDPFLLLGKCPPAMAEELKKAGAYKAHGTLCEAADKSIDYTVLHGALKPAVLKKALAEVKTLVVKEAEPGVVVATSGGREPAPDADRKAEALKAQLEKLRAGYGGSAGMMEVGLRGKLREALLLADKLKADAKWADLEKLLTTITMQMTAQAREHQLAVKGTEAQVKAAEATALAASQRENDAKQGITDLEKAITNAEKLVVDARAELDTAMKSLRPQGPQTGKPQPLTGHARQVQLKIENGLQAVVDLKKQLADAKLELAKDPDLAKRLVAELMALSRRVEAADRDYKLWADSMGFGVPKAGKLDNSPGLAGAREDLQAKLGGVGENQKKMLALADQHASTAARLRVAHDALAQDVLALTGKKLSDAVIAPYEQEVQQVRGQDPRDLAPGGKLSVQAAAVEAWIQQRASQVALVDKLGIPAKLQAHFAAKWGEKDAAMKETQTQLNEALGGAQAVSPGALKALTDPLALAGSPSWNAAWMKEQDASLAALKGKESPFDDMPAWARAAYLKGRDAVSGTDWKAAFKQVDDRVLGELKKRMLKLIADVGSTFGALHATEHGKVSAELNGAVNRMKALNDATSVLDVFRYRTSWEFEEKLAAQLEREMSAIDRARRPTRAQWAQHLGIRENGYRLVETPETFAYAGQTYRTHFRVSYDSITGTRPHIFGASAQSALNAAFVSSVPKVLQAHATIAFPVSDDNPHLYLTGDEIDAKGLEGADKELAKQVLTRVRVQLLAWLLQQVTSLQATLK